MLKKGTKIYSVLRGKCPRCHEGGFFKYSFTMNLFRVNKIKNTEIKFCIFFRLICFLKMYTAKIPKNK